MSALRRLLGIPACESSCERRGFHIRDADARAHIEQIGQTFLMGYHTALDAGNPDALGAQLDSIAPAWRGFAYEGAGMALTLLDLLLPWRRNRLAAFLRGPGAPHTYLVHVGAGWTLGRLPLRPERLLGRLDPLLGWLALDGYGFHEGYFGWQRTVRRQAVPAQLRGPAREVFDQGLGRSLWFVEGIDTERIAATIRTFPTARRSDLWSGVGLACAYAGGAEREAVERLLVAAGPHLPAVAQGVAFAAEARRSAQNITLDCRLACEVFWDLPLEEVALITVQARADLPLDQPARAYTLWRERIARRFVKKGVVA
ncbi:MAG TPA: DUF1702 family protein [Roseiflexaceae bacterium]|nr:DUF1702 family protein [Roseiflexaceae bacterium]